MTKPTGGPAFPDPGRAQNAKQRELLTENHRANGAQHGATAMIGKTCMVRTYSAGVFAGVLKSRDGKEAVLTDARRIWYWAGAATLSQLAIEGTKNPSECKFPAPVPEVLLTEVIEIIPMTDAAIASIATVPVWAK